MKASKVRFFIPSPSSRFFPQVSAFLQEKGMVIALRGKELHTQIGAVDILLARGFDIPNAVAMGWGDIGIAGLDVVEEVQSDEIEVVGKLGIRFSQVVLVSRKLNSVTAIRDYDTIVTEYKKIPQDYFLQRGMEKLNYVYVTGAAETYANIAAVSAIVTLKTSGKSLADNELKVLEILFETQACLIANVKSLRTKKGKIQAVIKKILY